MLRMIGKASLQMTLWSMEGFANIVVWLRQESQQIHKLMHQMSRYQIDLVGKICVKRHRLLSP